MSSADKIHQSSMKVKEKLRLNSLKLLHFDARDEAIVQQSFEHVQAFTSGVQLNFGLTPTHILHALKDAHQAADEYYTMKHAQQWNTDFVIPQEAIAADSALFQHCNYHFAAMCRHKQALLAANRISQERIWSVFGKNGNRVPGVDKKDVQILIEFAVSGITPPVAASFQPEATNVYGIKQYNIINCQ